MACAMQRYAFGVVTNNRTCNGGRVANTVGLPTRNGGSQPCNWQQAQSWCVQLSLANHDVDRCARSVHIFVKACQSAIGRSWAQSPSDTCLVGNLCLLADADVRRVLSNQELPPHCVRPCVLGNALERPTGDGDDGATATCLGECACVFLHM